MHKNVCSWLTSNVRLLSTKSLFSCGLGLLFDNLCVKEESTMSISWTNLIEILVVYCLSFVTKGLIEPYKM